MIDVCHSCVLLYGLDWVDCCSAKQLVKGEPNVSYICSRYYRAPELIFGATDYTTQIGQYIVHTNTAQESISGHTDHTTQIGQYIVRTNTEPELIFGATDYTAQIGQYIVRTNTEPELICLSRCVCVCVFRCLVGGLRVCLSVCLFV